jgi:hypothetical protein
MGERSAVAVSHPFEEQSPEFLDSLDGNPRLAFAEFYRFAVGLLTVNPPAPLRAVPTNDRIDVVHDLVLHCCQDDFRVLRRFDPERARFAVWFCCVARNFVTDRLRAKSQRPANPSPQEPDDALRRLRTRDAPADRRIWAEEVLQAVATALHQLGDVCQILLRGAAQGLRPNELTSLLRWPPEWNKKASDDLRSCRTRLRRALLAAGFDLDDLDSLQGS